MFVCLGQIIKNLYVILHSVNSHFIVVYHQPYLKVYHGNQVTVQCACEGFDSNVCQKKNKKQKNKKTKKKQQQQQTIARFFTLYIILLYILLNLPHSTFLVGIHGRIRLALEGLGKLGEV